MTFDLARAVKEGCRTRDGRPVRILATDREDPQWPVVVLVHYGPGNGEESRCYARDGRDNPDHDVDSDLVNLPEAHEVTVQLSKRDDRWCADVFVDGQRAGLAIGEPWPDWGKPVTVRIEKDQ